MKIDRIPDNIIPKKRDSTRVEVELLIAVGVMAFVILVIGGILSSGLIFKEQYNPDIHDCLEGRYCDEGATEVGLAVREGEPGCTWWFNREELKDFEEKYLEYYDNQVFECRDFEPKSKCQINPNDSENCVCDEVRRDCYNITINGNLEIAECIVFPKDCISAHEAPKPIKINLEKEKCVEYIRETIVINEENVNIACEECSQLQNNEICDKYCCIKKEDKNPCELGEIGWIEEETDEWTSTYGCNCDNFTTSSCYVYGTSQGRLIELYKPLINNSCEIYPEGRRVDPFPEDIIEVRIVNRTKCDLCYNYKTICREKLITDFQCKDYHRILHYSWRFVWVEDGKIEGDLKCPFNRVCFGMSFIYGTAQRMGCKI